MLSPARLVTGTAAAALAAAALGLSAAPSAHADVNGFGRERTAAVSVAGSTAECGPGTTETFEDSGSPDPTAPCTGDGTTAGDPAAAGDLYAEGEPEPTEGLDAAGEAQAPDPLDDADQPAALSGSLWPETDEDPAAEDLGAGTAKQPGDRPVPPPITDPGHAKPPTGRPSTPPTTRPGEPSGHVRTGVGGSAAPDTAQIAAGAGLVAAAAVGGALLLRRRRADGAHG
ncbi:hypothetical protein [Streptomyces sp. NPDC006289]|uniref:hypothetical protein n=1 Tax=Streptomyces sp. NPDC006289 TaxID=3156744 RepID=UPI0033B9C0E9